MMCDRSLNCFKFNNSDTDGYNFLKGIQKNCYENNLRPYIKIYFVSISGSKFMVVETSILYISNGIIKKKIGTK